MGELLRITKDGEPWQVISVPHQEKAAIEVFSKMNNYPQFKVIRFLDNELPWEDTPKERTIPGRYTNIDEKQMKRYRLQDGLYLLQWSEIGYREDWTPFEVCHGCYWKILEGSFKPVKVSPDKITKAYEDFQEEYEALQRRNQLTIVEGLPQNEEG